MNWARGLWSKHGFKEFPMGQTVELLIDIVFVELPPGFLFIGPREGGGHLFGWGIRSR